VDLRLDTKINYTNVCNVHCTFCASFGRNTTKKLHDVPTTWCWSA